MTKKLKYTELRSLDSTIEELQELVDGLRKGVLRVERGDQHLLLSPGAVLDFAVSAERKGVQERFELTPEWRRQDLTISSGLQGGSTASKFESRPAPAAARGVALQAETDRIEDSEPPVSSDDDDTVAPEDVDEAFTRMLSVTPTSSEPTPHAPNGVDDEAVTRRHSSPPDGQLSASPRAVDPDTEWLERVYWEARTRVTDDGPRLDEERFADLLAAAGLAPQLEQELHALARQADEAGRDRLFEHRSISDMIDSSLSGVA